LFIKNNDNSITIVLVYIDDIITTRNDQGEIKKKSQLKEKFDIKDLYLLKYFLRIEIAHLPKRPYYISKKIHIILIKRNQQVCK
jgi:Reverse transcriptase (RNA-dependent DNA polymerase)